MSADRGAAPTGPGAAYGGAMRRTLLLTNDFPPRPGGIQSFLHTLSLRLPAEDLMVYAPRWRGDSHLRFDAAQPYPVVRHPTTLMLPTPAVARRAARLVREHRIETVWFGAAAPLALLGPTLRRAGASRIVATTHGHEVGWSMLPLARRALRRIGDDADVITFVSRYTRGRFAAAFGPQGRLEYLPPGVDPTRFRPDPHARAMLRTRYRIGDAPTVVCLSRLVPRKGQDQLIRALPRIRSRVPGAKLVIVGGGPDAERLARLAAASPEAEHIVLTGGVPAEELAAHHAMADVFAMPCRTRGGGLDVEGLGIVFLEASACGVPVVAGDSGGAPETVRHGETGYVVSGRDIDAIADRIIELLGDRELARRMGEAGRRWVDRRWRWDVMADRLATLL